MNFTEELRKLFPLKLLILKDAGWLLTDEYNVSVISNSITGCSLKSSDKNLLIDFISEKYNQLEEERFSTRFNNVSNEDVLSYYGYSIVCKSPLEIEHKEGNLITGNCAHFTLVYFRKKYHSQ